MSAAVSATASAVASADGRRHDRHDRHVTWAVDVVEPRIKRPCACTGCSVCGPRLRPDKPSCGAWGAQRCEECIEWRCRGCMTVWVCKYCKRR